jgi:hypothetical protein
MNRSKLVRLKAIALTLMLPGLAGLITSAMISVHYLDSMPKFASPQELRTVPRSIDGVVIYQTVAEDRNLDLIEYSSVAVVLTGLAFGFVYLEKWGARQLSISEEEEPLAENYG